MMMRLWSKTGLRVGRNWQYRRDDVALVRDLQAGRDDKAE
jgi:hypothetical protein